MIAEIDIIPTVAIKVGDGDPTAVVVEIDLELLALLTGKKSHLERNADLGGAVLEVAAGGSV